MPTKDIDSMADTMIYIDGKPIGKIGEIEIKEVSLERPKTAKEKAIGILADIVTAVCAALIHFLIWIQKKK